MEELTQAFIDLCNQLGIAVTTGLDWTSQYYYYSKLTGSISSAIMVIWFIIAAVVGFIVIKKLMKLHDNEEGIFWDKDNYIVAMTLTITGIIVGTVALCLITHIIANNISGMLAPHGGVLMDIINRFK